MEQEHLKQTFSQLFEHSRHGLLWVDEYLRITAANRVALTILEQADGVRLRDQRLIFSRSDIGREVERLASTWRRGRAYPPNGTQVLRKIERPSGRGTLLLAASVINIGTPAQAILMLLEDLEAHPPLCDEICNVIYGLTPAEARVAARLLDGRSAPGIALDLGLSPLTVRTHIKRVFKKVGVRSQSQLMAALCRIAFLPGWVMGPISASKPLNGTLRVGDFRPVVQE
jgi:DNA-binding CsgD family transcriptional regulator